MATPAQIAANQLNSQKSTGPQSPQGKAKSSRNRLSHGFASSATLIPGEDPQQFKALLDALIADHQPATETEQILVEKMAVSHWLSLRAIRLQSEAFAAQSLDTHQFALPKQLALLIRYQTTAERAFHKAHAELVKTQKERSNSKIGFVPQKAAQPQQPAPSEPPNPPLKFKIDPDFTFLTPKAAAAAAIHTLCPRL